MLIIYLLLIRLVAGEGMKEGGTDIGVEGLQLLQKGGHVVTATVVLEGAQLFLLLIAGKEGVTGKVSLVHVPEGAYEGNGHLV